MSSDARISSLANTQRPTILRRALKNWQAEVCKEADKVRQVARLSIRKPTLTLERDFRSISSMRQHTPPFQATLVNGKTLDQVWEMLLPKKPQSN